MFQAALRVLEEIGLNVHNDEARQILGENEACPERSRRASIEEIVAEAEARVAE